MESGSDVVPNLSCDESDYKPGSSSSDESQDCDQGGDIVPCRFEPEALLSDSDEGEQAVEQGQFYSIPMDVGHLLTEW